MRRDPEKKPWAIFVYMVADAPEDPQLDEIAQEDLTEVFDAADLRQMHLAVQVDYSNQKGVVRTIAGRAPELLAESNAARPETLTGFIRAACAACPADRRLILLWGHSKGTAGLFSDPIPGGVPETLKLQDLARALHRGFGPTGVDIVVFKNCCLSALETAFEIRKVARYMVASETRVPARKWPYSNIFAALQGRVDTLAAGSAIVDALGRFYARSENRNHKSEVPFALVDLQRVADVTEPMRALVTALTDARKSGDGGSRVQDRLMRSSPHGGDPALLDVVTLCDRLDELALPELQGPAEALRNIVSEIVVRRHRPAGSPFSGVGLCYPPAASRGHSIFPVVVDGYAGLKFCRATGWQTIATNLAFSVGAPRPTAYKLREQFGGYAELMHQVTSNVILPALS
jgi:hypothetical protein